jgi:hypothetical protein
MFEHQPAQRRWDESAWTGALKDGAADQRLSSFDLRADGGLAPALE